MKLSSSFFTTPFLFSDNLQRQKIDLDIVIICGMIVIEQIFESVGTMGKYEKVELTNMCMVYDNDGNILVQDRVQKDWSGITFPGGI